jgi:hypothetical protein
LRQQISDDETDYLVEAESLAATGPPSFLADQF